MARTTRNQTYLKRVKLLEHHKDKIDHKNNAELIQRIKKYRRENRRLADIILKAQDAMEKGQILRAATILKVRTTGKGWVWDE